MSSVRELVYLYLGSDDVGRDLELYVDYLGGRLAWRFHEFGADVAGVELGDGPMVILADHRPAGSTIQIWTVASLDSAQAEMQERGWTATGSAVEVPDGPVLVLSDASGNHVGLMHQVRPRALERK